MEHLEFGIGKIGVKVVDCPLPTVILTKLTKTHAIGKSFCDEEGEPIIQLLFRNLAGLNVLIKALQRCEQNLIELPDELRMGA